MMTSADFPLLRSGAADAVPRVAVVFDPASVSPMGVATAGEGRWSVVWVLDAHDESFLSVVKVLRRIGPVVDVTGLDPAGAAAAITRHSPSGIVAFSDNQITRTAGIAAELGLPYYSPAAAERLTNKLSQRRALAAGHVDDLAFWPIPRDASPMERAAAVSRARFPVIVKPQVGNGSRLVRGADDAPELASYVDRILGGPEGTDLIVEERLADGIPRPQQVYGDYVSVESLVVDGAVHSVGVTGRFPLEAPFRESGFFTPADIAPDLRGEVLELVSRAVSALGIEHGTLHTEVKLTPAGPRIIEVNGRLGGGMSDILELASGRSLLDLAGRASMGQPLDLNGLAPCHRVGFLLYLQAPVAAGTIETLEGLAEAQAIPEIESVLINRRPGERVDWRDGNHGHFCSVLGWAPDHRAMLEVRERVMETVRATFSR